MAVDIEEIIREYLPGVVHMSLATSKDNKPWVCEVHFAYDNDLNLYFRSLRSRRHSQEIAENPQVAGNIVKQHQVGERPVGVYFEGTAQLLEPGDEQRIAHSCLSQRLHLGEELLEEAKDPNGHQFYKITVSDWYVFGNLDGEGNKKHHLPKGSSRFVMLTKVLHTGVEVDDLAASVELYKSLGFEVANEFEKPEPKAKVTTVKKGDTAFELWQFEDKTHPQVVYIRNHIAMYSDDLESDVQQLVGKGYKLVIPITEGVVLRYAFVQDPTGTFCYEIATEKG